MNAYWFTRTPRAIARCIQIAALAGCLVAGAGLGRSVAHAAPLPTPGSIPIAGPCGTFAKHDVLTASGVNYAGVTVTGTCFPILSTVHVAVRDLTRHTVLTGHMVKQGSRWVYQSWVAVRVGWLGGFQYGVQGTYPKDKVQIHVTDGTVNKTLDIIVLDFIP